MLSKSKSLSFREKRMLDRSRFLIISEVAEVTSRGATSVEGILDQALSKCIAARSRNLEKAKTAKAPVKPPWRSAPKRPSRVSRPAALQARSGTAGSGLFLYDAGMDLLAALGRTLGFSFAAGINLYATVALLGLASRFGWVALPPQYQAFDHDWIIYTAIALYLVEFLTDKIPWVDTVWDTLHTFIRPVGGALIAVTTLGEASPAVTALTALLGGVVAGSTHVTKAGTRVVANTSPEPFTNCCSASARMWRPPLSFPSAHGGEDKERKAHEQGNHYVVLQRRFVPQSVPRDNRGGERRFCRQFRLWPARQHA